MVPVLNTANIRDGELRRLSTWENNPDALALVDNVYHRIAGIGKDDGLITLEDAEGNTRLISPREAVAEGVTLYTPDTIRVGTGDRMRFTKSDRERGYVANSVWTVTAVSGDSVTLSDGQQTRVIRPGQEQAEQHIDLAYAITAHGAQGASETFAIALEGTEGNRKLMAGFESAYVALSRMKQHVQVYTDNRQGWTDAINNAVQKGTAHDVFEPKPAINRLWGWGIIAQFAYYLAGFPWYEGNILFAFAVAAQVLTWCETRSGWRTAAAILLMALWGPLSGTSYGIAGLLMLAVSHRLYRAEDRAERLALVACLLAVIPALNLATSDAAAVAGLVMTVLTVGLVSCAGKSLPRFWPGDFFPVFYACHLAVLGVLAL